MDTNAGKIQGWRDEHPGERITTEIVREILGTADLWDADLRDADLRDANLRGADLRGADLWDADLRGANLRGANLRGANLRGANLRDANLWGGMRLDGLPSGQATLIPTPDGWDLRVGCWHGTIDGLRALVAQDDGWPEAEGDEITRRRPGLLALIALCDAHVTAHPDIITDLAERWGSKEN